MEKHALISVYEKSNLKLICDEFKKNKISIISTGGTADFIKKIGHKCKLVSEITNFKEIIDGRVKTLHPHIFTSLLFNREREKHINEFKKINFPLIDYIIVNLYPFEKTINQKSSSDECIEMIDIGGPTLLRAAAKNFNDVTSICDPKDYKNLINNIKKNKGYTDLKFRKKMAKKIFLTTSKYDQKIYSWLNNNKKEKVIHYSKKIKLRYGENPHQKSFLYKIKSKNTFFDNIIQGKQLSFNNLKDIEIAYECVNEFDKPTSVIIKHCSPCGVASSNFIDKAFSHSINADPISAFGGIVAMNRIVNKKVANLIINNFYEIILAPNFTKDALKTLSKKKNMRLIKTESINMNLKSEIHLINDGCLTQDKNTVRIDKRNIKLVSKFKCSNKKLEDLIFALKVCKFVKSNAIVLANDLKTISIGAGQTSRVESTKIALNKVRKSNNSFIAASDAFFPFTDNIKILIKKNCTAIIQPSGSINDKNVVEFANKVKLPLYFTKFRFFKH